MRENFVRIVYCFVYHYLMATNKSSSSPHYYQIASSTSPSKLTSKSSESISNIEFQSQKQSNKTSKMKKSQTVVNGFETNSIQTPLTSVNSTSALRRRFSLFRMKRSQQQSSTNDDIQNENCNVQALQNIIGQLRRDLQIKTNELETIIFNFTGFWPHYFVLQL